MYYLILLHLDNFMLTLDVVLNVACEINGIGQEGSPVWHLLTHIDPTHTRYFQ